MAALLYVTIHLFMSGEADLLSSVKKNDRKRCSFHSSLLGCVSADVEQRGSTLNTSSPDVHLACTWKWVRRCVGLQDDRPYGYQPSQQQKRLCSYRVLSPR